MSPLIVGNTEGSEGRSDRLGLPIGTSDPGTAEAGDLYYKTDTNKIRYHDGTQWNDLAAGGGGGGGGGYTGIVGNSARFNSADQAYLTRNISSNITTFTLSMWVKRHGSARDDIFVTDSGTGFFFYFHTDGKLKINTNSGNIFESTGAYNDPSAWYHICINNDGSTFNLYVNGLLDKSVSVSTALSSGAMLFGRDRLSNPANHSDITLAEVHFVDGIVLGPGYFACGDSTTGVWNPKEFTGTGTTVNGGTVWSSTSTMTSGPSNAFDGNLSNGAVFSASGSTLTTAPITISNSIEFYHNRPQYVGINVTINGKTYNIPGHGSGNGWNTLRFPEPITTSGAITIADGQANSSSTLYGVRVDGVLMLDNTTTNISYGTAGFHLDFANGATDSSSNTNNFTTSGMDINGAGATITSFTGDNSNATSGVSTITGAGGYGNYAFINFINNTGQHTFYHLANNSTSTWFFSDSGHSYQSTHSSQQGGNTLGYRNGGNEYENHVSTFGDFATANGTTSGYVNSPSASDPGGPGGINGGTATGLNTTNAVNVWKFVVDTTYNKVWIDPGTGSYAGGGDPSNVQSTATFEIPNASLKFWSIPYASGNTNNIFSGADLFVDSPENGTASTGADPGGSVVGNYAAMNPLDEQFTNNGSFSEGNLKYVQSSTGSRGCRATIGVSSGKWYWEFEHLGGNASHGIQKASSDLGSYPGGLDADGISWFAGGNIYRDGSTSTYSGLTYAVGDCIGTALDLDNGTLVFYKNGISQGFAATGLSGEWFPAFGSSNVSVVSLLANFGQKKFKYAAPAGFKSLCSTNLPTPAISKGSSYVDAKPYYGNGTSNPQLLGFTPDFLIIKRRDGGNASGVVLDSIRGATKALETTNLNSEKTNDPAIGSFAAGSNNGFSLTGTYGQTNNAGTKYAAWAWDAGETTNSVSAGGLNSSAYDQSSTWSTSGTITNHDSENGQGIDKAFDGDLSTYWFPDSGTTSRYTFASVYTGSKFELYIGTSLASTNFSVNGQSSANVSGAINTQEWRDVTDAVTASGLGGLSYIDISFSSGNYSQYIYGIRIDGKLLVDNGVSVANIPSLATSYRATTTSGCSVVSYSGVDTPSVNTVAHGLDKAPELYMIKNRTSNSAQGWIANTTVFDGSVDYLIFNDTNAKADQGSPWSTTPTPYVFTLGANDNNTCDAGDDYIAYCFHSVEGFSRIGSFNNNDGEGAFVYCGFKPRIILAKNAIDLGSQTGVGDWMIYDTARNPFNGTGDQNTIAHNESNQEDGYYAATQATIDILSNGFKIKHYGSSPVGDPNRQIWFAAWAENPFALNSRAT